MAISNKCATVNSQLPHVLKLRDENSQLSRQLTMNYDQAGDKLLDMLISTCNGRMTSAEVLGHREFIMTRLYESA